MDVLLFTSYLDALLLHLDSHLRIYVLTSYLIDALLHLNSSTTAMRCSHVTQNLATHHNHQAPP